MIFVTVGAQMSFDRMVRAVDDWAGARGRRDVFAQIGPTSYRPRHIEWTEFIEPEEFRRRVQEASVLVAHAGMGSILTALEAGKPILVMPRRGDLRETRNDHQIATARRFLDLGKVAVAFDEAELPAKLDQVEMQTAAGKISPFASDRLLEAVRAFIRGGPAGGNRRG
ncbi:MAG: glycosyltransferase [Planctomycetota bacterium]|nr:glycosyltransferase [Planctomycetota bacterium]